MCRSVMMNHTMTQQSTTSRRCRRYWSTIVSYRDGPALPASQSPKRFPHREKTSPHDIGLAVWLSGNALASINVVALRQTRLVPGWMTVCGRRPQKVTGRVNHLGI